MKAEIKPQSNAEAHRRMADIGVTKRAGSADVKIQADIRKKRINVPPSVSPTEMSALFIRLAGEVESIFSLLEKLRVGRLLLEICLEVFISRSPFNRQSGGTDILSDH